MKHKAQPIPKDQPWAMGPWSVQFATHFALLADRMAAGELQVLRLFCHLLDQHGKGVGMKNSDIMRMLGRETNMGVTRAFVRLKALGLMDPRGKHHNDLVDRFAEPGGIPALITQADKAA